MSGKLLNYKAKQLKSTTLAIYSKNPPSGVWAAQSPTSQAFAELSKAQSLLGAYRSGTRA
jgi:hypothetical protein